MKQERWYVRHYAWIGLAALWVIGFIGAISRFIMASYQVQMSADLHVSRGFISVAWSTNLFIAALCAPVGGRLVDRYGPKKVMLIATLLSISGTGFVYMGHNPIFFFIGYGLLSGLAGLGASTAYVLLFSWFGRHKAKAAGILSSASSVGLAVCTPLFLSNRNLTWEYAFLASAFLGLVLTVPLILFIIRQPEKGGVVNSKSDSIDTPIEDHNQSIPSNRRPFNYPLLIVAFALFTCGINMGTVEMNLVAIHQQAEVTSGMIAFSMGILGAMEIIGSLGFGILMDVMNKRLAMTLLYGIRVLSFMILLLHTSWSPIVFAITFGLTYLGAVPGGMLIANEFSNKKGRLIGNLMLFHQDGGILGALVGGIAYEAFDNYQILIGIDAVLCVIAAVGYLILKQHHSIRKGELYHVA
ncbi:MFS transporter [Paenibacillus aceris]|uniref:MFS family permease n=1 Tax=Paenibacillus aceris TaxID=869555 RepID=A0ABS4I097_9BACL|nr:MFS transporter [Paenibacillus aceris]MBP1964338.1 MFS family permease [Paenibacillus aceris]NHW36657.1 MFS transporter [Paenibacillus aceris]